MEQKEIQECNKQIALMLGWKRHNHTSYFTWTKQNSKDHIYESILQFHSNWNWLMKAVKFIEELYIPVYINSNHCVIQSLGNKENNYHPSIYFEVYKTDKKEAVFYTVSNFAKYWNERNKINF
jgi:hypothetical protein